MLKGRHGGKERFFPEHIKPYADGAGHLRTVVHFYGQGIIAFFLKIGEVPLKIKILPRHAAGAFHLAAFAKIFLINHLAKGIREGKPCRVRGKIGTHRKPFGCHLFIAKAVTHQRHFRYKRIQSHKTDRLPTEGFPGFPVSNQGNAHRFSGHRPFRFGQVKPATPFRSGSGLEDHRL
ncbi:MAG: hypothetical protein BWX80_04201 [Candidatus Hydrogenedentes bacterium ADurb.Bin101]|nr:MAG: hypothetical protein BWX80_04201 [Candidatus Hydrogenedentes bacterium ADurb.Bin101]